MPEERTLFVEFTADRLALVWEGRPHVLKLERDPRGRLTQTTVEKGRELANNVAGRRVKAVVCAIPAKGLLLRRVPTPPGAVKNLRPAVALQLERELPLPPDQLAWGFAAPSNGAGKSMLVAAVRRDLIEDCLTVFDGLSASVRVTPAVLALARSHPLSAAGHGLLYLAGAEAELLFSDDDGVEHVRTFPFGEGGRRDAAGIQGLTEQLARHGPLRRLEIIGPGANEVAASVRSASVGEGVECVAHEPRSSNSPSPVLQELQTRPDGLLFLEGRAEAAGSARATGRVPVKWGAIAALLLIALFLSRYLEPVFKRPALEARIAELAPLRERFPEIDKELEFLQFVTQSQPAYLNALTLLADATPRGTRLESVTLNHRGDFALRVVLQNTEQAAELRSKLIDSGLFIKVVLEEQTPAENGRQLAVRISAKWNPAPDAKSKRLEEITRNPPESAPAPAPPMRRG